MKFRDLFPAKKVVCFTCKEKVKNFDLATVRVRGSDGCIEKKICKRCEMMFERNVNGKEST